MIPSCHQWCHAMLTFHGSYFKLSSDLPKLTQNKLLLHITFLWVIIDISQIFVVFCWLIFYFLIAFLRSFFPYFLICPPSKYGLTDWQLNRWRRCSLSKIESRFINAVLPILWAVSKYQSLTRQLTSLPNSVDCCHALLSLQVQRFQVEQIFQVCKIFWCLETWFFAQCNLRMATATDRV